MRFIRTAKWNHCAPLPLCKKGFDLEKSKGRIVSERPFTYLSQAHRITEGPILLDLSA
jgi:hypothetical protein